MDVRLSLIKKEKFGWCPSHLDQTSLLLSGLTCDPLTDEAHSRCALRVQLSRNAHVGPENDNKIERELASWNSVSILYNWHVVAPSMLEKCLEEPLLYDTVSAGRTIATQRKGIHGGFEDGANAIASLKYSFLCGSLDQQIQFALSSRY